MTHSKHFKKQTRVLCALSLMTHILIPYLLLAAEGTTPSTHSQNTSPTPDIQIIRGLVKTVDVEKNILLLQSNEKKIHLVFHPKNSRLLAENSNIAWSHLKENDEVMVRYVDESGKLFIRSLQLIKK